jgi:hypothetical protein
VQAPNNDAGSPSPEREVGPPAATSGEPPKLDFFRGELETVGHDAYHPVISAVQIHGLAHCIRRSPKVAPPER